MSHNKSLNIILWNATSVKNKTVELQNFLDIQNTDIAVVTETWLIPSDKIRLRNYNVYRKDETPHNKRSEGVLIATHKNIPVEDTPQQTLPNIGTVEIKLKTTPPLTIGAAYASPKISITKIDLDHIIPPHQVGHFIIGGDFNAKHSIWNNITRNANGSKIKNHADLKKLPNQYTT